MTPQEYIIQIEKALQLGNATEHTHRPALKALLESIAPNVTATNEPKRVRCGAPDYILTRGLIPIGYVEAKDVGTSLTEAEKSPQLKRYRESLSNLVLTEYLEFRWYVAGEPRFTTRLATLNAQGKLKFDKEGANQTLKLLQQFLAFETAGIDSPRELAARMAALAQLIRDSLRAAFSEEDLTDDKPDPLHDQLEGFREGV